MHRFESPIYQSWPAKSHVGARGLVSDKSREKGLGRSMERDTASLQSGVSLLDVSGLLKSEKIMCIEVVKRSKVGENAVPLSESYSFSLRTFEVLQLPIPMPQPPWCWNDRCASPGPADVIT
jgi:hypothetical protein